MVSRWTWCRRRAQPAWLSLAAVLFVVLTARWLMASFGRVSTTGPWYTRETNEANPYGYAANILAVQSARNATLQRACDMRRPASSLSRVEQRTLLGHLIVETNRKLLYCYVPKVACSNWKTMIRHLQSPGAEIEGVASHNDGLRMLSSFSEEDADIILRTYFKFIFVRDPLSRLLSAFRDKFRNEPYIMKRYGVAIVKECRIAADTERADGTDVTFSEFVCYLLKHPVDAFNEHWMPVYKLCQPCSISYDFIGKYENLEEEANAVLRSRAPGSGLSFPHRQSKYHPMQQQERQGLVRTLAPGTVERLQDLFEKDYSLFLYNKDQLV